jgi:hypothetical protein
LIPPVIGGNSDSNSDSDYFSHSESDSNSESDCDTVSYSVSETEVEVIGTGGSVNGTAKWSLPFDEDSQSSGTAVLDVIAVEALRTRRRHSCLHSTQTAGHSTGRGHAPSI